MTTNQIASFDIDREILLKALQKIQSIVDRRNTIPILSHLLIEAQKDQKIIFSATDLEVAVRSIDEGQVTSPGKVAVPAKSLYEIIKELPPNTNIQLRVLENFWIEIIAGKSFFKLVGQDPEEFPQLPPMNQEQAFLISTSNFIQMIDHTIFAVSNDQARYDLSGVFVEQIKLKENIYLRMVATDGHRLSMMDQKMNNQKEMDLQKGVILPRKGLMEFKRLFSEVNEVYLSFLENNVICWSGDQHITLFMRLLDGDFPDYTPVIPQNNDRRIVIQKEQLLNSLKRISVLTSEHSRSVRFQFQKGKLRLSSSNPKLGEAREDIDVHYHGGELEIGFNAGYFVDVLEAMSEQEEVVLELTDVLSPSLIKGKEFDGSLNIVMPMQLGNETVS